MDTRRILATLLLLSATLFAAPSAEDIYKRSVKVLSFEKIKFHVTSRMKSKNYSEVQRFSLANYSHADESASLICFLAPKSVKGTAILLKKDAQSSSTLVYFPSLGRSRIVPKRDEDNEAFGLGLSFSEMQNQAKSLTQLSDVIRGKKSYYKIAKEGKKHKTIYLIDKKTMVIKEMDIYEGEQLIKKVIVDKFALLHHKPFIIKWHIEDFVKQKETSYSVDTKSISTAFSKDIFKRSAISHCR